MKHTFERRKIKNIAIAHTTRKMEHQKQGYAFFVHEDKFTFFEHPVSHTHKVKSYIL